MSWLIPVFATIATAATPLLFAALGELVAEKSGVLNLGVEGMMIVGAIAGFAAALSTGNMTLAVVIAVLAAMAVAALFGALVLWLRCAQVPTGLALTLFGLGLSALIGRSYVGKALDGLPEGIPLLADIPLVGKLLFGYDALVYLSLVMTGVVWWFLTRTRAGLVVRAVGEDHNAARSLGYPVLAVRFGAVLFGGAMAGLGGAYLSLAYTPLWAENMTAGRGWIALALVVFASWRPARALAGAYLFGGVTILQLYLQGRGIGVSAQYMSMLPYLATIAVLAWASSRSGSGQLNAPACLGRSFVPQ